MSALVTVTVGGGTRITAASLPDVHSVTSIVSKSEIIHIKATELSIFTNIAVNNAILEGCERVSTECILERKKQRESI